MQRHIHVLRHARAIAAHIKVRAFLEPRPKLRGILAHLVLHVNLVLLVA